MGQLAPPRYCPSLPLNTLLKRLTRLNTLVHGVVNGQKEFRVVPWLNWIEQPPKRRVRGRKKMERHAVRKKAALHEPCSEPYEGEN